ncbi:hypothetical protein [Streptomyces sp. NPDC095817]|uniref:hypothetical protein n=1 Tax=Streptomyces sp. NPDC095817 TaxID=3155082 RepID=UPI00331921B7
MALNDPHPGPGHLPSPDDPQASLLQGDEVLRCGRRLSHVWEEARDAAPTAETHTAQCDSCQEALEGLKALDRATASLRASARPSGQRLTERVIRAVRAEGRLGAILSLNDTEHDLRIMESAAAKILRKAADALPGTRAASCRLTPTEDGTAVHVAMTLAASLDHPLHERAEQVRQAVFHAADRTLGLAVTSIDLKIDSVLDLPDTGLAEPPERSRTQ